MSIPANHPGVLRMLIDGSAVDTTPGRAKGSGVTEADFQRVVLQIAELGGWDVFSIPDSRRATCGGFLDLTLKHDTGPVPIIVAELKREGEQPRADQVAWAAAWERAGVPVYCWRPSDMDQIREVLK